MTVPVLIGADLLSRRKFYWDAERRIINWGGQSYKQQPYNISSGMCRSVEVFKIEVSEIFFQVKTKMVVPSNKLTTWHVSGLEPGKTYLLEKVNIGPVRDILVPVSIVIKANHQGDIYIPISTKRKNRQVLKPGTTMFEGHVLEEKDIETEPVERVNQIRVTNEMLPHFDSAQGDSRRERLNNLIDQIHLNHVNEVDRNCLISLLLEYNQLFVLGENELGHINESPESIPMLDSMPVRGPMYRHPEHAKTIIAEMIKDMLEKGIIENSTAVYLAPIVLVTKGNGKKRMCIDYRKVNEHIKQDIYPLPRLDALVEEVAGHKYYITLDMKDAYYQVTLENEARDITTFSDGIGLYRFTRLPFGLSVSPAIFTRVMQRVLEPLTKLGWVRNYLDDVIIFADSLAELWERLRLVFDRFLEKGIKLNVSKCEFAKEQIKFLGHLVSHKGMKPDPSNVQKIKDMEPPKNPKQVRRFIGMTGFYRKFIDAYAKIAAPLTNLTKKGIIFHWSEECQSAFEELKTRLLTEPVLTKFCGEMLHELHTDASKYHIGAVMLQKEKDGLKSLGYFSKKLNTTEQKYSATDKEALAIVQACRFFHHYLWARRFTIVTDHQPLMNIFKQRTKCPRMSRYILEMRDYNFRIVYKKGISHRVPDALSRPTVNMVNVVENVRQVVKLDGISPERLVQEQRSDPQWREVIQYFQEGPLPRKLPGNRPITSFELIDEILYVKKGDFDRPIYCIVIPATLRASACEMAHKEGHLGERKSVSRAQRLFYWPKMWTDVKKYVQHCATCQMYRNEGGLQRKHQRLPPVEDKGQRVSLDIIDLHYGTLGYRYCLTVIDHYSRFLRVYPMRNKTSQEVGKYLNRDVNMFGRPKVLVMDNGGEFKNLYIQSLCNKLGITQAFSMPYHPQGNAVTERVHRTLKSCIAKVNEKHPNRWPEVVQDCVRIINESVHLSLGTSPFFAHFGYHPLRTVGEVELPEGDITLSPGAVRELIKKNLEEKTASYRLKANLSRREDTVNVNDWVWVKNQRPIPGTAVKLNPSWIGPYKVVKVLGQNKGYEVEDRFTGTKMIRGTEQLKIFKGDLDIIAAPCETKDDVVLVPEYLRPIRNVRPPDRYIPG